MKRWLKILLFCLCSLTLISWDRETKNLAKEHLMNKESLSYLHDTFRLEYVENTGAAMNLGDGLSKTVSFWLLSILPMACLLILFIYAIKKSNKFPFLKMLPFALIFAGGIGNITDRLIFDRHVPDFMNIGFNNIRTGIFNFADVWVTIGVTSLALIYRNKKPNVP
jgi:signal peptidase II